MELSTSITRSQSTAVSKDATTTVTTRKRIPASPAKVWTSLLFYEELGILPPLVLRLLLPVPTGTEGLVSAVGDEVRCNYRTGYLVKRITALQQDVNYEFEIIKQSLTLGRGIILSGGRYLLRDCGDGTTELSVETNFRSSRSPRWFWRIFERPTCHAFHNYLLESIGRRIDSQPGD
ncbi:MAG: hypothetical protein HKN43_03155 [Rhodothermales bacterium]|nr:hypothetical protein [Rhodothermales bacterium]